MGQDCGVAMGMEAVGVYPEVLWQTCPHRLRPLLWDNGSFSCLMRAPAPARHWMLCTATIGCSNLSGCGGSAWRASAHGQWQSTGNRRQRRRAPRNAFSSSAVRILKLLSGCIWDMQTLRAWRTVNTAPVQVHFFIDSSCQLVVAFLSSISISQSRSHYVRARPLASPAARVAL